MDTETLKMWNEENEEYNPGPFVTEERKNRFKSILEKRQPTLTLVLENVHDPHNVSAILRSCDAVGIMEVHVVNSVAPKPPKLGRKSSASARKWVDVHFYNDPAQCLPKLKERGFSIFATHLSTEAKSLYDLDLAAPVALVFGNEHEGCTEEILKYTDGNFIIPMMGMVQSLNVSVATAVSLYEALRQREVKGMYNSAQLTGETCRAIYEHWCDRETRKK